jgi:hypothetical protein
MAIVEVKPPMGRFWGKIARRDPYEINSLDC